MLVRFINVSCKTRAFSPACSWVQRASAVGVLMVKTSGRWAGFVQYVNKATHYATPLLTTAVPLCKDYRHLCGTFLSFSSFAHPCESTAAPRGPPPSQNTCLPSPDQGCSEACQNNIFFEDTGALHSAGPSTLNRSKRALGKRHQETLPHPRESQGLSSNLVCPP